MDTEQDAIWATFECNIYIDKKIVTEHLTTQGKLQWPSDCDALAKRRNDLRTQLSDDLASLVDLNIVSYFLLSVRPSEAIRDWCAASLHLPGVLGLDAPTIFSVGWLRIQVASSQVYGDGGTIVSFLVAALDSFPSPPIHYPPWLETVLDQDALAAVNDAITAAKQTNRSATRRHPFLFPLVPPQTPKQIEQRSLALPLALGCRAALEGARLADRMIATGDLDISGAGQTIPTRSVGAIRVKAEKAAEEGYHLFLYSQNSHPGKGLPQGLCAISVATFEDAWMWAALYAPGREKDLRSLQTARQSVDDFVAIISHLPEDLLHWTVRNGRHCPHVDSIVCSHDLADKFVRALENCLDSANRNLAKATAIGSMLTEDVKIDRLGQTSPLAAFKWCSLNMARSNHYGDNAASRSWGYKACRFMDQARKVDAEEVSRFINRRLVTDRHNCFFFGTDLPEEFVFSLKEEEKFKRPGTASYPLGSMYGTICQNFAFCGPAHLQQTIDAAVKAQEAFGDGRVTERLGAWRRQFSCLVYAFLDAGKFAEAKDNIFLFLETSTWDDLKLSPDTDIWNLYPLTRFLADSVKTNDSSLIDTGNRDRLTGTLLDLGSSIQPSKLEHPWQLFFFNVGRLARQSGHLETASALWRRSLNFCETLESLEGETPAVMALLPLAALNRANELTDVEKEKAKNILYLISNSQFLNKNHFTDLLSASTLKEALALVAKHPEKYFPFNYR